ncbi:hypothetical protein NMY22_g16477 [Coprinellus aureogranulatus]|nr:hypothetical protein NMY22_g16477 [Coprinellus aureogranulatus]
MPSFGLVQASNNAYHPPYVPVVVVFGGTSGIGLAMARRLAEQLQGRLYLIVVGRNKVAADKLFASLPTAPSTGTERPDSGLQCNYEFISCDLTLMSNAHDACTEISARCPKVNYVVLASGASWLGARNETSEGIDKLFALRFYYKFAVISGLIPALRRAREKGEAAGAFVIGGNGRGPVGIDFTDLGAKRNYWWGAGPMALCLPYGDLMLSVSGCCCLPVTLPSRAVSQPDGQMFAERYPDIAFTTMFPGQVRTEGGLSPQAFSNPIWKFIAWVLDPLRWLLFTPVDVSAEYMVYGLLNGDRGFYQRTTAGDSVGPRGVDYSDEEREAFWNHCVNMTRSGAN